MAKDTFSFEEALAPQAPAAPATFSFDDALTPAPKAQPNPDALPTMGGDDNWGAITEAATAPGKPKYNSVLERTLAENPSVPEVDYQANLEAMSKSVSPESVMYAPGRALRDANAAVAAGKARLEEDAAAKAKIRAMPVPQMTAKGLAGDITGGALKIVPTAAKGVTDITSLATGGIVGHDSSAAIQDFMERIDKATESGRSKVQKSKFELDMEDDSVSIADAVLNNKGALSSQILPTLGSMVLPMGAAGVAGKLSTVGKVAQGLDAAGKIARAGKAAEAAVIATTVLQNASDTFNTVLDKGGSLADAYLAAGITAPFTAAAGKLTGGGAELAFAKRLFNGRVSQAGGALRQVAGASIKEGGQESVEQVGQSFGEAVGTGQEINLARMGKEVAASAALGAVIGGGGHVAGMRGEAQSTPAPMTTAAELAVSKGFLTHPQAPRVENQPTTPQAPMPRAPQIQQAPNDARTIQQQILDAERADAPSATDTATPTAPDVVPAAPSAPLQVQPAAGGVAGPSYQPAQPVQSGPLSAPVIPTGTDPRSTLAAELAALKTRSTTGDTNGTQATETEQAKAQRQEEPAAPTGLAAEIGAIKKQTKQGAALAIAAQSATESIAPETSYNEPIGRNNAPISQGGKPFKKQLDAKQAKKMHPTLRVVAVDGGYVLAPKTEKQLAAQANAARRLSVARTGKAGVPIAAHEFIAGEGGLDKGTSSEFSFGKNPRVGNRNLFAGVGKPGMTLERATEKLKEAGYLAPEATHSDAVALIQRSFSSPQYTPEGFERMAEAERAQHYQDHLQAQQDAPEEDPFGPLGIEPQDVENSDYHSLDAQLQAEVHALLQHAEAVGIDVDAIKEDAANATNGQSQDAYHTAVKSALEKALAGSVASGSTNTGEQDQAGVQEGLTAPTREDVVAQQDRAEQAAKEKEQADRAAQKQAAEDEDRKRIAQASVAAADSFELGGDAMDNLTGQQDIFSASEPAPKSASTQNKISDFGEKIGGAKKDTWTGFKDDLSAVADDEIASRKLSEIWPAPDYQKLIDEGMDVKSVATIRALRDEIPSKPRDSYKVKRWAEQVKTMRDLAANILDGKDTGAKVVAQLERGTRTLKGIAGRVDLYVAVGHDKSLEGISLLHHHYSLYRGRENVSLWVVEREANATTFSSWPQELAIGDTKEDAIAAFKARHAELDSIAAVKKASFDIYSQDGKFFIGKKIGRNIAEMAGPFKTLKEARDHRANNLTALEAKLAKYKETPNERRDTNEPRVGEDMRNGQDVTPELFSQSFGFKGVEFGNWVEQKRRQKDLNDAFDALMDMAAIMGVPAKAISLNGELGLAFGARGSGGVNPAAAHYEPGKVVINLTKREGAGSLGHEWWHALDNYFSRMRGSKTSPFMTTATDVSLSSRGAQYEAYPGVRKEMIDAFGEVVRSIKTTAIKARSSKMDAKRTKEYWTTGEEMAARAFESYLISKLQDQNASNDYLANVVDEKTWDAMAALGMENEGSYPYPTAGEMPVIRAGFDKFFQTLQTKETDKGVMLFSKTTRNLDQDITLSIPLEDGKTAKLTVNAKAYIDQLNAREDALRMVKECMG